MIEVFTWQYQAISLLQICNSKYSDPKKVSVEETPMGNWRLFYDGHDTGCTVGRQQLYIR